ncbi:MAG: toll/interleukin-1 receptor domain-containing protein [bacterium]|nr:toll/interleukin-1 receptor domain-containing protein [bacterium]
MLGKDKTEKSTLHFLDLVNNELYYLSYGFLSTWDYGRIVYVRFSLDGSNNELVYENVIGIDNGRRKEDLEPALRYFLHLYREGSPRVRREGDYLLVGDLRDEYQFPGIIDDTILTVKVLEALESFESYHPVEGLSNLDLMISLDVDRQPLLRAINRLTARGIVKSTSLEPRYAIADYDKKDSYIEKFREKTINAYSGKERNSHSRPSVIYTIKAFIDASSPGQDGVSYELIYEAVDSDLIGTPEESASTRHGIIAISGSRDLRRKWGLDSNDFKKVLFEITKRKLEESVHIDNYDLQPITLHTRNSPPETPYDPQRISIILNEPYDVELRPTIVKKTNQSELDAFICHASEDKESFVRPLAEALQEKGLRVWYDDFTLRVGDSLRRRIDDGLARSRYGIVVLSPSFFKKEWPQKELDGLFQKEGKGEKVILPVWHEVGIEDVRKHSLTLADKVGVSSSKELEHVVEELLKAMHYYPRERA